jgi:glycosyltransferase involved in cell wall biosynthesis
LKYFDFPKEKIHIITPKFNLPALIVKGRDLFDKNQLNLFFPASPLIYKNHAIVIEALSLLDVEIQRKISIYFTCVNQDLYYLIKNTKTQYLINYMGVISFDDVLCAYRDADALIFPSYIETFGLPLIEAASFGIPIIVADLPYSHEVLQDYSGVVYVPYDDPKQWSEKILGLFITKGKKYQPFKAELSNSWHELFRIMKNKIENHVEK